ncbi:hypothetical protein M3603_08445 [Rummeliibacillus stabekisii]|uniref:hypothetical protein n=1 Tax=Rummeliibacillus stabekisii TaxID=241244 RepID=UPI00203D5E7D|nr:hypothetical protein [Rummeliibacillus stabekisii]MCM3316706.1 hypothetical protein [Rummeliibacillus stabekisii]
MFETVQNHEERIVNLERADHEHEERLKRLEDSHIKLENTMMVESRETRTVMKEQTDKVFELVENTMGFQSTKNTQNHELKMLKWNTLATVFLKVCGGIVALFTTGGAFYYVLEHYFK